MVFMFFSNNDLPNRPSSNLNRQLSIRYRLPNGDFSSDCPSAFTGNERSSREDAILEQFPWTGYADGIRENRNQLEFEQIRL